MSSNRSETNLNFSEGDSSCKSTVNHRGADYQERGRRYTEAVGDSNRTGWRFIR
jgi:hypothetical protein